MTKWQRKKRVELRGLATALMGAPESPLWIIPVWFYGGMLVNVLSGLLGLPGLALISVPIFGGYIWLMLWQRRKTALVPELVEREPRGKHGLILPLSPINPFGGMDETQLQALIDRLHDDSPAPPTDGDFALLERSNLESPLRAIEHHYEKSTLRDCWLITTEDVTYPDGKTERGSWYAAKILERWFFHRHPEAHNKIRFHYGEPWHVHPRDYAKMWLLVDEIFEQAPYKAENVIVDITPGTKPMTLAIGLACLEPKRTMQYIAAGRHPLTGEVLVSGRRVPVLIDVDPYLYRQE